jgi:hypothetical protein
MLATWRRTFIGFLNELEPPAQRASGEGLGSRIQRLSHEQRIPRDVAAMMRLITDMRNLTEYEA